VPSDITPTELSTPSGAAHRQFTPQLSETNAHPYEDANSKTYSATSIIFAQSIFVPASVLADTGRISSTSWNFFKAAIDFAS